MQMDLTFSHPNVFLHMNFLNTIFNGIKEIPYNIAFGCISTDQFASFHNNYVSRILALNSNPMDLNSIILFYHILLTFLMRVGEIVLIRSGSAFSSLRLPFSNFILALIRVVKIMCWKIIFQRKIGNC